MTAVDTYLSQLIADGVLSVSPQSGPLDGKFDLEIDKIYVYGDLPLYNSQYYYDKISEYENAKKTKSLFHRRVPPVVYADQTEVPENGWIDANRTGFILCKNRVSWRDGICSFDLQCSIDFAAQGLVLSSFTMNSGDQVRIDFSTTRIIKVDKTLPVALLEVETEVESSPMVPIGGIIGWNNAKPIPYGYAKCDGSFGTPDLIGKYIKGSSSNSDSTQNIDTGTEHPATLDVYNLIFIMRYK